MGDKPNTCDKPNTFVAAYRTSWSILVLVCPLSAKDSIGMYTEGLIAGNKDVSEAHAFITSLQALMGSKFIASKS